MKLPKLVFTSEKPQGTHGYISVSDDDKTKYNQAFKGEVHDVPVKFPKELGAEHPFNFEDVEKVYKSVGIINGGINKIADSIVGEFSFKTKTKAGTFLVNEFIKNTNFKSVLREWTIEGLQKGNGFAELDLAEKNVRVLNSNNMYVKRNNKRKIIEYNQWVGDLKRFSRTNSKFNTFEPKQIAHLKINEVSDEPYGIGLIWPNERVIENLILNEQELHKLISRKAGAPIHVTVGREGETVNTTDIDTFKNNLQYMTNRTEWVTDSNVKMDVISFGDIGKNLTDILNHDMLTLAYGMEIPIVLFGAGNIAEGLAKVQLEAFQRKICAIQDKIESIIEEQIFKPLLESEGIDDEVEFSWNLPGENEINNRLDRLIKLIESINTSEPLRRMVELEVAKLLNIEDASKYLTAPEKETNDDKDSRPGAKPPSNPTPSNPDGNSKPPKDEDKDEDKDKNGDKDKELHKHIHFDLISDDMTLKEYVNLKEQKGYSYSEYLNYILKALKIDKFEFLAAKDKMDIADGKLPNTDIETLRDILDGGFKENKSIGDIKKEIKSRIKLKDAKKDDVVLMSAKERPELIARTETIRFANLGLVKTYKKHGVERVQWIAAESERTCEQCMALDGKIYDIDSVSAPPLHPACRCSLLSVR